MSALEQHLALLDAVWQPLTVTVAAFRADGLVSEAVSCDAIVTSPFCDWLQRVRVCHVLGVDGVHAFSLVAT